MCHIAPHLSLKISRLLLLAAVLVCSPLRAYGQRPQNLHRYKSTDDLPKLHLNVTGGLNAAGVKRMFLGYDFRDYRLGFQGGVEVGYRCYKLLGVRLGVLYTQQGTALFNLVDAATYAHLRLDYIEIPLLISLFGLPGHHLYAGVQWGYLVKAFLQKAQATAQEDLKAQGMFKSTCWSIIVGSEYEVLALGLLLGWRVNIGLSDIAQNNSNASKAKSIRGTSIYLGYNFARLLE